MYQCEKCGNTNPKYIGFHNGNPYCRRCILLIGKEVEYDEEYIINNSDYTLSFELSKEQKEISTQLVSNYLNNKSSFLEAVCGAGKTELVFETIKTCLMNNGRVGFAIPRRDVVIELEKRFKEVFKKSKIVSVYGGHHDVLEADIIMLTTHQLYRYNDYFDLLILDEIDAFPFKDNELLHVMMKKSIRGVHILMSATPNEREVQAYKKEGTFLTLHRRYHGHPLIIPETKVLPFGKRFIVLYYLMKLQKEHKPVFIFAPTIKKAEKLFLFLKCFVRNGEAVHSKKVERKIIIDKFRDGHLDFLVTTSILERGVTVKNLQVIIYEADHLNYDRGTLIQISGRVGRKIDAYDGE